MHFIFKKITQASKSELAHQRESVLLGNYQYYHIQKTLCVLVCHTYKLRDFFHGPPTISRNEWWNSNSVTIGKNVPIVVQNV